MRPFVVAELRARRRMIAGLGAGAFTLLLIVALAYRSIGLDALGAAFGHHAPSAFTAFSGSHGGDILSPHGWMGFGFNHPMFLVVTLAVAISVGAGAVAGEVDSGRAELVFTTPIPRRRFLAASLAIWLLAELAVVAAGWLGALIGALCSSDLRDAGIADLAWAPLQYLPLALFVAACAFLASAAASTRGRANGIALGIAVFWYLLNVVSGLIHSLDWLRWLTPFGYYEPSRAIERGLQLGPATLLVGLAVLLLAAAVELTDRRDLA